MRAVRFGKPFLWNGGIESAEESGSLSRYRMGTSTSMRNLPGVKDLWFTKTREEGQVGFEGHSVEKNFVGALSNLYILKSFREVRERGRRDDRTGEKGINLP